MKPASFPIKKLGKTDREKKILLGLIDYYLKSGKPVGSNSLKEAGFDDLSSATIRNYCAHLEKEGYLIQTHASGGRVPTHAAYRFYCEEYLHDPLLKEEMSSLNPLKEFASKEIVSFLQEAAEVLSQAAQCAVFLSAPRFDQDFIRELKLVPLDAQRCLCILVSDFGVIQSELLPIPNRFSSFAIKRIESYFSWKLKGSPEPHHLSPEEEKIAQEFYKELMLRYIVSYSTFVDEDVYRTGFSRLLAHEDFQETAHLAASLSLFENIQGMRLLLKETKSLDRLKCWIGADLAPYTKSDPNCSVMAIPFYIHQSGAGAVGVLGPTRLPYRELFQLLKCFSLLVSETLTKIIYKFKISFRQPGEEQTALLKEEQRLIGQSRLILLDNPCRKE